MYWIHLLLTSTVREFTGMADLNIATMLDITELCDLINLLQATFYGHFVSLRTTFQAYKIVSGSHILCLAS